MNGPLAGIGMGLRPDPMLGTDRHFRIVSFNEGAEAAFGYPAREVLGRPVTILFPERFLEPLQTQVGELQDEDGAGSPRSCRLSLCGLRRDGTEVPLDATVTTVGTGRQRWLVAVFRELGNPRAEDGEAYPGGGADRLTGLPDRALFRALVDRSLPSLQEQGVKGAMVLLDLNRFRLITHTLGHEAGDDLLTQVGQRLQSRLRPGDVVGRYGSDQFALFLQGVVDVKEISALVGEFLEAFTEPFPVHDREVFVTASGGVSVHPGNGARAETLLQRADLARTQVGSPVQNNWAFYTPELDTGAWDRLNLQSRLNRALERSEFRLMYQPIVNLADFDIVGVEALVRWQHPERGLVEPNEFIPLLEETGKIVEVGQWMVETACAQLGEWHAQGLGGLELSLNLSPRHVADPRLVDVLERAIRANGLRASYLRLEITENLFLQDLPGAEEGLNLLHDSGFRLSLDDFGTGFSAMNYLRRLPFHHLKIDRTFLDHIPEVVEDTALVQGIIQMAETLTIQTVAEGVQNADQADVLRWLGCLEAQGFGFSPPVPADAIARMMLEGPNFPLGPGRQPRKA